MPDGRRAISGSNDGTLKVWDLEQVTLLRLLTAMRMGSMRWPMPDGRRAFSGSAHDTLKVWDLERSALLRTLDGHARGSFRWR